MREKLQGYWRSAVQKILALSESPQRVALGVALGLALDFLPVPVISIPLAYLLARIFRFSPAAAVITVVFFKWAVPLFFTLDYMVGRLLLGAGTASGQPVWHGMPDTGHLHPQYWLNWLGHLGRPFVLGAVLNASLVFILSYAATYRFLKCQERRKPRKKLRLSSHRPNPVNHKARL